MSWAGELGRGLLDLVFAPVCVACGGPIPTSGGERRVCRVCWSRARPIPRPICDRCGAPLPSAVTMSSAPLACTTCRDLPASIRVVRSAFVMEGTARQLVHALKYRGWHSLARPMGVQMAALPLPLEAEEEVRFVLPVPLSHGRMRERGYNQAEVLARAVARARRRECRPDMLLRSRATGRQATLHPAERRANVAGAFQVPDAAVQAIHGEHLLLVDDVWTTGATALACADALLGAGARAISVLTFARALPELRR
ncbi:MAG TPA: ComF family protein [Longimicrobiaceae bacterium]|nr:ComF family protein [Longimicrobiaceae bacterium]